MNWNFDRFLYYSDKGSLKKSIFIILFIIVLFIVCVISDVLRANPVQNTGNVDTQVQNK